MVSASADSSAPPTFEPLNVVELDSVKDSKIVGVSVYSGRAEITRLFKFTVKTGQNHVNITCLPAVLDQQSFRVEGRGAATIQDVTISTLIPPPRPTTSTKLKELLLKKKQIEKSIERTRKALASIETYLNSLNAEHTEVAKLAGIIKSYDTTAEELDSKLLDLGGQIEVIDEEITEERKILEGPIGNDKLSLKAAIGVFANNEGQVQIALIYAVHDASWTAGYDIRVNMQTKEKAVELVYKGAITQSTGEDWTDISLTLETAAPTFGEGIPVLTPWALSIRPVLTRPPTIVMRSAAPMLAAPPTLTRSAAAYDFPYERAAPQSAPMQHRNLEVSSKGNISATFAVPGMLTIPSDGVAHNVTIVRLDLDAIMSWVCVPKKDAKTHLNAKIKNQSEYTLLSGPASVYVDGSFISRSDVPAVSPEERFDCPLGLDPSIRITYHPRIKKVSQTGFYQKSSNYIFTQRITVHNTKNLPVENVKLIDQVPISEDSTINVKLVSPMLTLPSSDGSSARNGSAGVLKVPPAVKVTTGVVAQWDGVDENTEDVDSVGKDGKFSWMCALPAQGKASLVLQWEVTAPLKTDIVGL